MKEKQPVMLMILDGWGINPSQEGNAVRLSNTPFLNSLFKEHPHTQLICSGHSVGLPEGVMGNSEVGHLNIGAGRVVYQDVVRIDKAIQDKSFHQNKAFVDLLSQLHTKQSRLHLMGLVSDGAVHSHINHIFALLDLAKEKQVPVLVHAILDGRDTPPDSGQHYIAQLQDYMERIQWGSIASLCGRFYAMDRDKRWERVEKAFLLYTKGDGIQEDDPVMAVKNAYARGETDEFIHPILMNQSKNDKQNIILDQDGVIFFNFRADRAREITHALTDTTFSEFQRNPLPQLSGYITMTLYEEHFNLPMAFPPVHLSKILGQVVSESGCHQLRIAETEKYAHVTYFFNGGEETPFPNEDRALIPSPKEVETYDQKPEMSALKVTEELIQRIQTDKYDLIVANFANLDMVGHTGILEAAIKACETVDQCISRVIPEFLSRQGIVILTADHGNAEKMIDQEGKPHTAHTTNPVPLVLISTHMKNMSLKQGKLGDIAPTILSLMNIPIPKEMTGISLIDKEI